MMITETQKQLTERRTALALQVEIPDMATYALEWKKLGADFEKVGWVNNAKICYSNAERYGAMNRGKYERMLEEIPVKLENTSQMIIDSNGVVAQRSLFCLSCDDWTPHYLNLDNEYVCENGCPGSVVVAALTEWAREGEG